MHIKFVVHCYRMARRATGNQLITIMYVINARSSVAGARGTHRGQDPQVPDAAGLGLSPDLLEGRYLIVAGRHYYLPDALVLRKR